MRESIRLEGLMIRLSLYEGPKTIAEHQRFLTDLEAFFLFGQRSRNMRCHDMDEDFLANSAALNTQKYGFSKTVVR